MVVEAAESKMVAERASCPVEVESDRTQLDCALD